MLEIIFLILAVLAIGSALSVILVRDIFRAALCLILLFLNIAGMYVMLHADFLAVVQVLVYVGAISVLLIVAIMLTRDVRQGKSLGNMKYFGGVAALCLLGVMAYSITNTPWVISDMQPLEQTVKPIGEILFGEPGYLATVEMSAVLLLSAVLGSIVIIREK